MNEREKLMRVAKAAYEFVLTEDFSIKSSKIINSDEKYQKLKKELSQIVEIIEGVENE